MNIQSRKKRVAAGLIALSGVVLLLFVAEYAVLTLTVKNDLLKKNITDYFMNTFNKAVLFDRVSVSPTGKVTLTDFVMSKEGDFNDNVAFIKSKNLYIRISVFNLLRNRVLIRSIYIPDPEITLVKNSGVSYDEFLKRLFAPKQNMNTMVRNELNHFSAEIRNASIAYREIYSLDSVNLVLKNIDADVFIKDGSLEVKASGTINKFRNEFNGDGSFSFCGFFSFPDVLVPNSVASRILDLKISDFDISYLSPYVTESFYPDIVFSGTASADVTVKEIGQAASCSGSLDIAGLNIIQNKNETTKREMVSDAKIHCSAVAEKTGPSKYRLAAFSLDDGILTLSAEGVVNAGLKRSFEGLLTVKADDLNPFFKKFPVFNRYAVSSLVDMQSYCALDIENEIDDCVKGYIHINNIHSDAIKKGSVSIETENHLIKTSAELYWGNSDVSLSASTEVLRWNDFSSKTKLGIHSQNIDGVALGSSCIAGLNQLYQYAWDDRKKGYEDIRFLSTSAGHYIAGNDVSIEAHIQSVDLNGASLKNGELQMSMSAGRLTTEKFVLEGYGALYSFKADALFNTDFPMLKIESSLSDFNLAAALKDAKVKGLDSGLLSASFIYSMNGNRPSHIVENGTIDALCELKNAEVSVNEWSKKIYEYGNVNGLSAKPENTKISRAGFVYKQLGDNGMIGDFTCSSDTLNFSGYGKYNFNDGLRIVIPSAVYSVKNTDGSMKNETAPFIISGRLSEPLLTVDKKNPSGNLVLYKAD